LRSDALKDLLSIGFSLKEALALLEKAKKEKLIAIEFQELRKLEDWLTEEDDAEFQLAYAQLIREGLPEVEVKRRVQEMIQEVVLKRRMVKV